MEQGKKGNEKEENKDNKRIKFHAIIGLERKKERIRLGYDEGRESCKRSHVTKMMNSASSRSNRRGN